MYKDTPKIVGDLTGELGLGWGLTCHSTQSLWVVNVLTPDLWVLFATASGGH